MSALISCWNSVIRCLGGAAAVLLLVISLGVILACDRNRFERTANVRVAEEVEQARALFAGHQWGRAEEVLEAALVTPGATDLERARALLEEVEQAEASSLLAGAKEALGRKRPGRASDLLKRYLAHPAPTAMEKSAAEGLLREIRSATSDAKAAELLAQLPDERL